MNQFVFSQGRLGVNKEHFTALCYAGHLPGFCMGFNRHGFVFTINVIRPIDLIVGKTRKLIFSVTE